MTAPLRGLYFALLIALLGSCGFQLRGSANLPFDTIWIDLPTGDPLGRELSSVLSANGVSIAASDTGAARLQLQRNSLVRRVQSVGPNARVREFELVYELTFSVKSAADEAFVTNSNISLRRDYSFDQAEVLGAASEEEYLRSEMIREMAVQIVRAIEFKTR